MADAKQTSFLGRGWSFPPSFDVDARGVQMTENEADIERSLHILLTTAVGERVMLPKYGCDMADYLFASMNTTTKSSIKLNPCLLPRIVGSPFSLRGDSRRRLLSAVFCHPPTESASCSCSRCLLYQAL